MIERPIGIVGCGLIGGSLGLALRRTRVPVIGLDRPEVLDRALDRGAIDEAASSLDTLTHTCPTIVLALPLTPLLELLDHHVEMLERAELVLDVAGVKQVVHARASKIRGFVGGHPMAGSERSSIEAARHDLFTDRPFVLCSDAPGPIERARELVVMLGAKPVVMTAAEHDLEIARLSHLPHLLAQAAMACEPSERAGPMLAAGSWRDLTRVAKSDPSQWAALFAANAPALAHALDDLLAVLQEARRRLGDPDRAAQPVDDAAALAQARAAVDPELP